MKQAEMAKWLKSIVLFTGTVGLVFVLGAAPVLMGQLAQRNPAFSYLAPWGVVFCWVTAVPVYLALFKVWQICTEINNNNSFSHRNALLLRDISHLSVLDSVLYLLAGVCMLVFGHYDVLLLLLIFGAILLGIFFAGVTAALSHLTDKASALKHENDLTI